MAEFRLLGALELSSTEAHPPAAILGHTKRIALLTYLALATPRGCHRRDKLLALFWPDSDEAHARGALSQALYLLRQSLGEDLFVTRGDEEVGLNWEKWWVDVVELRTAAAAERYDDVLKLYRGDLLEGFHATASPEFEQWLDGERAAARKSVLTAALELAARAEARRRYADAIEWLRRAAAIEPLDETVAERLMELLHRSGDAAGALAEFDRLSARLAADLEAAPSVQLAALAGRIRATAAAPDVRPGSVAAIRRRRMIAIALAIVALAALVWTAFLARRPPSLYATGALDERDLILIADFGNTTTDKALGAIVTELVRVDFDQSRSLRMLQPAQVRETLKRMLRDTVRFVKGEIAREVAIREGAKAILEGEIGLLGSRYVLTARITAAENGAVLMSFRQVARSSDDLIDAVEALSHEARVGIGEKLGAVRKAAPLANATTASLPALRAYVAAQKANQQGRNDEVIAQLEAAIAADSTFVAAHRWLANAYFAQFQGNRHAAEHLTLAYRYSGRLPEFERLLTEGTYHSHVSGDSIKAIAAFTRAMEIADDQLQHVAVFEHLGGLYARHGDLARAEAMWQARADLHRTTPRENIIPRRWGYVFNLLTQVQLAAGRIDAAERTVHTAESYFGKHHWFGAAQIAAARHDYDSAEALLRQIPDDHDAQLQLFDMLFLRGRLREATSLPLANRWGRRAELLRTFLDFWFFKRPEAACARIDALVARDSLERTVVPTKPPYVQLVALYAYGGRMSDARHWFHKVQSVHYDLRLAHAVATNFYGDAFMRGMMAFGEKDTATAIPYLRAANEKNHLCRTCQLVELALAYQAAGQVDSAIAVLERYTAGPQMGTVGFNAAVAIPFAHVRLGELYEGKRDWANAARRYAAFVELWQQADPELQPFVRDVRRSLQRINGMKGA